MLVLSALVLSGCGGLFGGDEPDAPAAVPVEPVVEAPEQEEVEERSVLQLPAVPEQTGEEPIDDLDPVGAGVDSAKADEALEVGEALEADEALAADETVDDPLGDGGGQEAEFESECWWETEEGGDVFSEYAVATVVCTVLATERAGVSESDDGLAAATDVSSVLDGTVSPDDITSPDGSDLFDDAIGPDELDLGGVAGFDQTGLLDEFSILPEELAPMGLLESEPPVLEARFGWRCSAGEAVGESLESDDDPSGPPGRLEVFASNGEEPETLQVVSAEQQREASVLVRFGSDPHPYLPRFEVVVVGEDIADVEEVTADLQRITYDRLWRNSYLRPPRDRAGVLSLLEDRNLGGRIDEDEWETSQEHSRHDANLLFAPDDLIDPITASLVRDTTGRLHTAVAGVYIDFDISGWQEHVVPVLERCGFDAESVELFDPAAGDPREEDDAAGDLQGEDDAAGDPREEDDAAGDPGDANGEAN